MENEKKNCGNDNEDSGENLAFNRKGSKGYRNHVISQISGQEQLESTSNDINVRELSADPATPAYNVNPELIGKEYGAETKADPEPKVESEMARYSFMHECNQEEFKKNTGTPKFARTDATADSATKTEKAE